MDGMDDDRDRPGILGDLARMVGYRKYWTAGFWIDEDWGLKIRLRMVCLPKIVQNGRLDSR